MGRIEFFLVDLRLLDLFRTVLPNKNKLNRHIMDTEKVHSIKHCHVVKVSKQLYVYEQYAH